MSHRAMDTQTFSRKLNVSALALLLLLLMILAVQNWRSGLNAESVAMLTGAGPQDATALAQEPWIMPVPLH